MERLSQLELINQEVNSFESIETIQYGRARKTGGHLIKNNEKYKERKAPYNIFLFYIFNKNIDFFPYLKLLTYYKYKKGKRI